MAYGTLTSTAINRIRAGARDLWEIVLDWKAHTTAGGYRDSVHLNIATILASNHPKIFRTDSFGGFLSSVETIAGSSGDLTTNVATSMNVTLEDPYGLDVMAGVLYNRSSTAAERVYADPPIALNSELELNIGSTKTYGAEGRLIMWVEQ